MEFSVTESDVTGCNLVLPNVMSQDGIYSYRIEGHRIEFIVIELDISGYSLIVPNLLS